MEQRVRFVEHKGKKILLEDFSGITDDDTLISLINEALEMVRSQPKNSVLVLVDLTNARLTPKVYQVSKAATEENSPYIKATTIVGVSGIMDILSKAVSAFARRELTSFSTREEAMDWLVQQ
ncbi:MAG: hypothetical protein JXB30_19840 [Anaerolineae bacterium]|nr:hypothetical protein [Anaerolineae bacterium]